MALSHGDVVAIEHVDRSTGEWRWAIASVVTELDAQDFHKPARTSKPQNGGTGSGEFVADPSGTQTENNDSPTKSPGKASKASVPSPERLGPRALCLRAWEPVPRDDLSAAEKAEAARLHKEAQKALAECMEEQLRLDAAKAKLTQSRADVDDELSELEERLSHVLPALDAARAKVALISAKHLREIRGYKSPPEVVRRVIQPVQVLLGEPQRAIGDWEQAKSMMAHTDFIVWVQYLEPAELSDAVLARFMALMSKEFGDEKSKEEETKLAKRRASRGDAKKDDRPRQEIEIERAYHASSACGPLMEWVYAMWELLKTLPKDSKDMMKRAAALRRATEDLKQSMDDLEDKLAEANKRRKMLDEQLGKLRSGATGGIIDHGNRKATPYILLFAGDVKETSSWRPMLGPDGLTVSLAASVILRLRLAPDWNAATPKKVAAADDDDDDAPKPKKELGIFWLTPDMVKRVRQMSTNAPQVVDFSDHPSRPAVQQQQPAQRATKAAVRGDVPPLDNQAVAIHVSPPPEGPSPARSSPDHIASSHISPESAMGHSKKSDNGEVEALDLKKVKPAPDMEKSGGASLSARFESPSTSLRRSNSNSIAADQSKPAATARPSAVVKLPAVRGTPAVPSVPPSLKTPKDASVELTPRKVDPGNARVAAPASSTNAGWRRARVQSGPAFK